MDDSTYETEEEPTPETESDEDIDSACSLMTVFSTEKFARYKFAGPYRMTSVSCLYDQKLGNSILM